MLESLLTDVLRAGGVALLAHWLGRWLARSWQPATLRHWVLLLIPLFTPAILTGYSFGGLRMAAPGIFHATPAVYFLMLLLKLTPVAVIVRHFLPTPLTEEGRFLFYHTAGHIPWKERARFRILSSGTGPWLAAALVFLLAFSEFELAAMWNVRRWSVVLFDAHAGGLALAESVRLAAGPALIQLAGIGAVLWLGGQAQPSAPSVPGTAAKMSAGPDVYLLLAALAVTIIPLGWVLAQGAMGAKGLVAVGSFGSDLLASAIFAGLSGAVAAWVARNVVSDRRWTVLVLSPGLLGGLVLSLLLLSFFQLPGIQAVYDTPLPLALALSLLLVPLAVLLALGERAVRPDEALFIARQQHAGPVLWALQGQRRFVAAALLFGWAYFDFTASSLLAPVGLTPVFVRLHNLMHYGQTAVLSAMVATATLLPVLLFLGAGAIARFLVHRHGR